MPDLKLTTLDRLLPGESGVIRGFTETQDLHYRLKELGLVPGTWIKVRRCAPLADPMELRIRGYYLSIRKQDAKCILVEKDTERNGEDSCCERRRQHRHRGGHEDQ
ncbi:MAG TPA: FeoA family protein [Candidatus Omnitrophota bacterium]|nr:FeoA family protein [Candidatus Omnitrophota bacterium]